MTYEVLQRWVSYAWVASIVMLLFWGAWVLMWEKPRERRRERDDARRLWRR